MSETKDKTTIAHEMDKKAAEIQDKVGNPDFKVQAVDPSKDKSVFVEAFDHFSAASSRAWLEMALSNPEFRCMSEQEKIGALVNGTLAGVIGVVMSKLDDAHADKATEYVRNCIEPASVNAANLIAEWKACAAQFVREREGHAPGAKLN